MKSGVFVQGQSQSTRFQIAVLAIAWAMFGVAALADARENDAALLRQQTELFADASQHGDQATMTRLLDDEALFSGGSGTVDTINPDAKRDHPESISALLKKKTLILLLADISGHRSFAQKLIDANAVWVKENGAVSNPHDDLVFQTPALSRDVSLYPSLTDWMLHCVGDVAITSFTETRRVHLSGQRLVYQSLFVNTWLHRGNAWVLIGSQSIPLHQDPPTLPLATQVLDKYVGHYSAVPGLTVAVSRDGTALVSSVNGGKPTPLIAVARDVFSRPGLPVGSARPQITFQRDAGGKITGYVSRSPGLGNLMFARDETTSDLQTPMTITPGALKLRDFIVHQFGDVAVVTFLHDRSTKIGEQVAKTTYRSSEAWIKRGNVWKMISSQGCEVPPDPQAVSLTATALDDYVGTYQAGPHLSIAVHRTGTMLTASTPGGAPMKLTAQSPDVFFVPGVPLESFIFQRDPGGPVTHCVFRYAERDLTFMRV